MNSCTTLSAMFILGARNFYSRRIYGTKNRRRKPAAGARKWSGLSGDWTWGYEL